LLVSVQPGPVGTKEGTGKSARGAPCAGKYQSSPGGTLGSGASGTSQAATSSWPSSSKSARTARSNHLPGGASSARAPSCQRVAFGGAISARRPSKLASGVAAGAEAAARALGSTGLRGAALSIANGVYGFLLPQESQPDTAKLRATALAAHATALAPALLRMRLIGAAGVSGP
jgi:hypothetical protein